MKSSDAAAVNTGKGRFVLLICCFLLAVTGILSRAVYLHVINAPFLLKQGDARAIRQEIIPAHRGTIMDKHGAALAVSTPLKSIWINPKELLLHRDEVNNEGLWRNIAVSCGIPPEKFRQLILRHRNKEFLYVKRRMAPDKAVLITSKYDTGVYSRVEYGRFYPASEVAAHVVGLTDIDDNGQEGLELAYNEWLAGEPGVKRVVKNLHGRHVKDLSLLKHAQPGNDLQLSIDMRVQHIAYRELAAAVNKHHADSAYLTILDVETGEVLAMVNQPAFNPNNRTHIKPTLLRNRVVTDLIEPGSIVKPFTVAAALDSGKFTRDTLVNTRPIRLNRKRIEDTHYYGIIDVEKILTKSSNVGAAKLALSVGAEKLSQYFSIMGLGQTTSSGFPGERSGTLPVHMTWKDIEIATMSYGYGLSVTTLQLAHAYATLAGGGIRYPVSLLKLDKKPVGERVMDERTANNVVSMLETVVSSKGTASRAQVPGYRIAGKTGTVHQLVSGRYAEDKYRSLFAGIAPASNPKVVMVVVVNNPRGEEYYGGFVAAPIFSNIMKQVLPLLNIKPDKAQLRLTELKKLDEVVL